MRIKSEAKRAAYIKAAGQIFIELGFSAATMGAVAAVVGGSKVTLYNYFSSKEALFEAFVVEAGRSGIERLLNVQTHGHEPRKILNELGIRLLELVTTPAVIELDRLIISEAKRQPELSRIYYDNGPKRAFSAIIYVMEKLMQTGFIHGVSANMAALHFKALCCSEILEHQLWMLGPIPDEVQQQSIVTNAVNVFLDSYAKR
jgi:TetR/AcrR family transcriptional regulator, mexJK operon transcriptional repressor